MNKFISYGGMFKQNSCVPPILSTPGKGSAGKMVVVKYKCTHKNDVRSVVIPAKK